MPPIADSTRLSVMNWRRMRPRLAPTARRTTDGVVGVAGHVEDLRSRTPAGQDAGQLRPAQPGHHHVGQHHLIVPAVERLMPMRPSAWRPRARGSRRLQRLARHWRSISSSSTSSTVSPPRERGGRRRRLGGRGLATRGRKIWKRVPRPGRLCTQM